MRRSTGLLMVLAVALVARLQPMSAQEHVPRALVKQDLATPAILADPFSATPLLPKGQPGALRGVGRLRDVVRGHGGAG